jgi:hypothetical protein
MNAGMKLVVAFVALFIAIVLLAVIADQTTAATSYITQSDETLSIASARLAGGALNSSVLIPVKYLATDWRAGTDAPKECQPGNTANPVAFVLKNSTGATLTRSTHYNVTNQGYVTVGNVVSLNGSTSNSTTVTYAYCNTDYQSGISAVFIKLIAGFLAILVLAISIALMYSAYEDFKN